ncbi:hypothetical protein D3C79_405640 [compost metagenome]
MPTSQARLPWREMTQSFHQRGTGYHDQLCRHLLRLADESLQQLTISCAITLLRQAAGHELCQFASDDISLTLAVVVRDIHAELPTQAPPGQEEIASLVIQIQTRLTADPPSSARPWPPRASNWFTSADLHSPALLL